jgi:CMP-N-acetylneuraminic acid synthetase
VPRKNIIDVNGKPLLAYTIELAKQVPEFDAVVVSSEDDEILAVAEKYGAEPLKRPAELAEDATQDEPVLIHALQTLEAQGRPFDYIAMLHCTVPLRKLETVRKIIAEGVSGKFDTVGSVVEDKGWFRWHRDGKWIPIVPGASRRSQEREPYYREADVCYIMNAQKLIETGKMYGGTHDFIIVGAMENVDINTLFDLELVRTIMKIQK